MCGVVIGVDATSGDCRDAPELADVEARMELRAGRLRWEDGGWVFQEPETAYFAVQISDSKGETLAPVEGKIEVPGACTDERSSSSVPRFRNSPPLTRTLVSK